MRSFFLNEENLSCKLALNILTFYLGSDSINGKYLALPVQQASTKIHIHHFTCFGPLHFRTLPDTIKRQCSCISYKTQTEYNTI